MRVRALHVIGSLVSFSLFALALFVLGSELKNYRYSEITRELWSIGGGVLLLAQALTLIDYLILTGYDTLALRYIGLELPYPKVMLASFVSYAFSHNLGFTLLTGGSVRYRLYTAWGLSALDVTKIVGFTGLAFWLGVIGMGSVAYLVAPLDVPVGLHLPWTSLRPLGALLSVLLLAYLAWALFAPRGTVKLKDWEFPKPSRFLCLVQLFLGLADWLVAGGVLYVLLPPASNVPYLGFVGAFLLAQALGFMSHVPGGLGVFESIMLLFLSPYIPVSSLVGALVAYRGVYYLMPLALAAVLLVAYEVSQRRERVQKVARLVGRWLPSLAPRLLAISTFVAGAVLLVSGATPSVHRRMDRLEDYLPLMVIEVSHLVGSVAGMGLLLLARGLQRRLDVAYFLGVGLLGAGIVVSLLKGFDFEEAAVLVLVLAALLPCRRYFYRKASLVSQRFTPGWVAAILIVLVGSIWLGFFSYKHVEYREDLWWRFTLFGDAPRFLRASVGAVGIALAFSVAHLLSPSPPQPVKPDEASLAAAEKVVQGAPTTAASLALLGDKSLLFNERSTAFIMYGIEGRSWVSMGDPVGSPDEIPELLWRFVEICDQHDGWTVFYEVGRANLHLYLDLGLTLLKLGESARVRLEDFSIEGRSKRSLRSSANKAEREGCVFEMLTPAEVAGRMPELEAISSAWLVHKSTREKRFSLGNFSPRYLERFPAAVVRQGDRLVAFANVWQAGDKEELSLDLMRYLPEAPGGVMEFLFTELMLWGKNEGYRWFDLGMAPLSGMEDRALSPLWNRMGAFVFRYGEHFYNFQGLRQYKEKFEPEWEPKYLASPGGLALPIILTNVASLVSGGLRGAVSK